MTRQLAISAVWLSLLGGTICVIWSGLNFPPPLWIVRYGLPGSQGPTGRVARVEGMEFREFVPGYFRAIVAPTCVNDCGWDLVERLQVRPGCPGFIRTDGSMRSFAWRWVVLRETAWIRPSGVEQGGVDRVRDFARYLGRSSGLPVRLTGPSEAALAETAAWTWGEDWFYLSAEPERWSVAFTLTPDQEHLIEPYLVHDK